MACGFLLIPKKVFPTPYSYIFSTASIVWGFTHSSLFYLNFIFMLGAQWGFPGGSVVENPPANEGEKGPIPGSGISPGEGHGSPTPVFLPGKPHGQRSQPGRLQSMGTQRVRHDWACTHTHGVQEGTNFLSLGSSFMTVIFFPSFCFFHSYTYSSLELNSTIWESWFPFTSKDFFLLSK